MFKIFSNLLLSIFFVSSLYAIDFKEDENIKNIFENEKVNGTFIIYDVQKDTLIGYNEKRAKTLYIPASTFKIYNALIALDSGVVKNVDEIIFKYDGKTDYFLENWKKDSSLRDAIKVSNLPAFQEVARKVGLAKMKKGVNKLQYGNKVVGSKIDDFWLNTLKITPIQQTNLLASLAKEELSFSKKSQQDVKEIILLDNINGWKLYGKTGLSTKDSPIGWLVGFVEKDNKIYSFALNMDMENEAYISKRTTLVKKSLESYGLLK